MCRNNQGEISISARERDMLWHILVGGTPGDCLNFDFSDELSIHKMIEALPVEDKEKK